MATARVFDGAFNVTLNEDVPAGIYRLEVKAIDSSDVVFSPNFEIDPPIKTSQSRSTSSRPDPAAIAFIVVAVVALFISVIICALLDRQRRKRHAPDKIGIKTQLGELTEKVKAQAGWPGGAHRERLYL